MNVEKNREKLLTWTLVIRAIAAPVVGIIKNSSVIGCGRSSGACSSSYSPQIHNFRNYVVESMPYNLELQMPFMKLWPVEQELKDHTDGISITHDPSPSRKHIWSFVAANSERSPHTLERCPCSDTRSSWQFSVPNFIGNNYFCDSGQERFSYTFDYFSEDPLWDGEGCSQISSCCTQ